jgi:hypothetical protein
MNTSEHCNINHNKPDHIEYFENYHSPFTKNIIHTTSYVNFLQEYFGKNEYDTINHQQQYSIQGFPIIFNISIGNITHCKSKGHTSPTPSFFLTIDYSQSYRAYHENTPQGLSWGKMMYLHLIEKSHDIAWKFMKERGCTLAKHSHLCSYPKFMAIVEPICEQPVIKKFRNQIESSFNGTNTAPTKSSE